MEKSVAERHHHVLASLPAWHQGVDQTDASWGEQVGALECITKRLDVLQVLLQTLHGRAVYHGRQFVRPLYIDGPPGTGKTFIGLHAMRLVASKVCSSDMQWDITAVSAQRAAVLGGEHIHALFGFVPGRSCFYSSYQQLAATSLAHLQRHPEKKRRLHQLEVLFIDEMCQVGCPLLLAIDAVLQKVKGNDMPFGGVFVLGAGDHYQNEPINEMSPLQSRFVQVHFDVLSLKELFRSRNDPLLQQLIGKMRVPEMRARDVEWVLDMLQCDEKDCHCNQRERDHCHHIEDAKDAPLDAIWLLPKKVAVNDARREYFKKATERKVIFTASDHVLVSGAWKTTTERTNVRVLNKHSTLVDQCYVVKGGRMQVTQNTWVNGRFACNGASGCVTAIGHDSITVDISHPIRVGEVEFHRVDKPNVVFGSVQLKRVQFPLELCVATTIHDIQGTQPNVLRRMGMQIGNT